MALSTPKTSDGKKLDTGQTQLQSEGAECFIKDIHFSPNLKIPDWIKKEAEFKL